MKDTIKDIIKYEKPTLILLAFIFTLFAAFMVLWLVLCIKYLGEPMSEVPRWIWIIIHL